MALSNSLLKIRGQTLKLQQRIVIAGPHLVGVDFAPVKDNPLNQSAKN